MWSPPHQWGAPRSACRDKAAPRSAPPPPPGRRHVADVPTSAGLTHTCSPSGRQDSPWRAHSPCCAGVARVWSTPAVDLAVSPSLRLSRRFRLYMRLTARCAQRRCDSPRPALQRDGGGRGAWRQGFQGMVCMHQALVGSCRKPFTCNRISDTPAASVMCCAASCWRAQRHRSFPQSTWPLPCALPPAGSCGQRPCSSLA